MSREISSQCFRGSLHRDYQEVDGYDVGNRRALDLPWPLFVYVLWWNILFLDLREFIVFHDDF